MHKLFRNFLKIRLYIDTGCGGYLIDEGVITSNPSVKEFDDLLKYFGETRSCEWFIESSDEDAAILIKFDEVKYDYYLSSMHHDVKVIFTILIFIKLRISCSLYFIIASETT